MSAVETGQMTAAETSVLSQQKKSALSQQKTSVLFQQKTSLLSQQQTSNIENWNWGLSELCLGLSLSFCGGCSSGGRPTPFDQRAGALWSLGMLGQASDAWQALSTEHNDIIPGLS